MRIIFAKRQNIFKNSEKKSQHIYVIYATPKNCNFKFDIHLEGKKDKSECE
jgi:hypothetical protein